MELAEAVQQEAKKRPAGGIPQGKKKTVAVLTPTLGKVSMWWHTAMVDLVWPMNTGRTFIPMQDFHGGEIGEMRNRLVQMVLQFEAARGDIEVEHIMWIDDDVIVARMAMQQLLSHDADIASGVYFCKGEVNPQPLIFAGGASGALPFKPGETFTAWGWSQGLCLIRTEIYRRMQEELELGEDKYGNPRWYHTPDFGVGPDGGLITGGTEDFAFFENASKLGYAPIIDCTKFAFGWHYSLEEKTAYPKPQWEQFVRRESIIWPANRHHGEVIWE